MYLAFISPNKDLQSYIGAKRNKGFSFGTSPEGYVYLFDLSPKRHRLIEVYREIQPKSDFSIITQSDLLAYGNPQIKKTRISFLVKIKSLYDLALASYEAVRGGVYSVYGQRVMEFETSPNSRWRVAIFSSLPSDVNKYFQHLSPSDVRIVRYRDS
ncbi:hypothetical protein phiLo_163 [Thermus phage phiLo]|nr:hypothetical protein phiLo_163 [Thermus phage phiLo]